MNNYRKFLQMRTNNNSAVPIYFFFYNRNDSASYAEDFGTLFFVSMQFFLKFSKIWKKIDFKAFFMHISLYGGNRENRVKNASERYLYGPKYAL